MHIPMLTYKIIWIIAALLTALITGLFYAYSCSINNGLGRLPDTEYMKSMQSINRAILNPLFFASFMGTVLILPVCTWFTYKTGGASMAFYLILAAAIIYIAGVFGVTIAGNVPLNNALDKFNITAASAEEIKAQRDAFEIPWNRLHTIRTIACVVSLLLTLASVLTRFK
jgi:uncharacterized membrane protein